jgi:hypothetical protein
MAAMSSRAPWLGTVAVAVVPLALVLSLGFSQGGYLPDTWVWATPLAAWAAGLGALLGGGGALRRDWPWPVAAGALLAWTAASALWSVLPHQSLLEARRTALYATVLLALVVLARRRATTVLVIGTHAAISLLLFDALGRYLLGTRRFDPFEGYLLAEPLGYANAVGVVAALGIVLALGVAAHASARQARGAAAATVPPFALALALSGSHASWLALAVGCGAAVSVGGAGPLVGPVAVTAPGAAVLLALASAMRFTVNDVAPSRRDGAVVAAVAGLVAVATGAVAGRRRRGTSGRHGGRAGLLLLAGLVVVGVLTATVAVHVRVSDPRSSYWHVAWRDEVVAHPVLGTGAGTFGRYWANSGLVVAQGGALDAHSLYVETLGELGPVGVVLLAAVLLLPLRGLVRRGTGPLTPAAAGAYATLLVHAGLDWDWELPAVVIAGLACAAAVLLGEDEQPEPPPAAARAAVVAAALALGAIGLAGARSSLVPSAQRARAPRSGALGVTMSRRREQSG